MLNISKQIYHTLVKYPSNRIGYARLLFYAVSAT